METVSETRQYQLRTRDGTGLRKRGTDRVRAILKAAEDIFLDGGYQNLTMRSIAQRADISLSNLTYYFKTKDDLFQTLMDGVTARYADQLGRTIKKYPDDPKERFNAYMSYLLKDCRRPRTRAFFYHFWAVSTHDPFVSSMRERSYELFFNLTRELCLALNPDVPDEVLNQRTYLLLSLIEGMHVIYGNQGKMPETLGRIENEFLKQANLIACSP